MEPAIICYSAPISAREKDGQGQRQPALALLGERLGVKLGPTIIGYSTPEQRVREGAAAAGPGAAPRHVGSEAGTHHHLLQHPA